MKWVIACIKNKLIIYILSILLCILGLFCISIIKIAPFPSTQSNTITISFGFPGANAQTVQQQATSKIILGLQSINNIQNIVANSQAGSAEIDLTLNKETVEETLQTQMQIIQVIASSNLPTGVQQPQVKINKGVSGLITMALVSDKTPMFTLQTLAKSTLLPNLSGLPGVLLSTDNFDPVVKVMLNPQAMTTYKLNPPEIAQSLNEIYQSNPLGELSIEHQSYVLNMPNNFQSLDDLSKIIIGYQRANAADNLTSLFGTPIYLKDIAKLSFESRSIEQENTFAVDGKTAVIVNLQTTSTANPFSVSKRTNEYLSHLKKDLSKDVGVVQLFDMSDLMHDSITEVVDTIIISSALVLWVAFLFLGRFKATLIPIITIPVCLLSAITFIYLLGFSINILTLLALVIAVGLVVDDAVVVVENITRYIEQGMSKSEAIVKGSSDIALTIIGITLTLVFVYLPIAFSSNDVADLFKPFALTLASAIFVSGIVALTLTPVMAVTFLTDQPLNHYQIRFDSILKGIIYKYHNLLAGIITSKTRSLVFIGLFILIGGYIAMQLPIKVFPDDPNRMISIKVIGSYQDTVKSLEKELATFSPFYKNKMLSNYMLIVDRDKSSGQLYGALNLILKPEYVKSSYDFADEINQTIQSNHFSNAFVKVNNVSNWGGDYDLSFYVYGGSNIVAINKAVEYMTFAMKNTGNFSFVSNQINQPRKQLIFNVNEAPAASLGIFMHTITQLLSTYYGGYTLDNYFSIQGLTVPIIVQDNNNDLKDPKSLQKILIQSPITQKYYPIDNFVSLNIEARPLVITTFDGQPAVQVMANLNSNYSISQAIKYVNEYMQANYPTIQYQFVDAAEDYLRSNNQALLISLMGIFSVYFLLAILFKNLIDPLIILLTVPFSIVGGALSLYLIDSSINLYSALGLITLVGLITKHGILIVQFANNELKNGSSVIDAILNATSLRFRPIIMTTLVMVLGALPLLFSSNIFYMARENLAITIIGGLLVGTLFSLFVVPLVYILIKKVEGEK